MEEGRVMERSCVVFISYVNLQGGVKLENSRSKKPKSTQLAEHTRVDNNKTNKAQASRFRSTVSHHSSRCDNIKYLDCIEIQP